MNLDFDGLFSGCILLDVSAVNTSVGDVINYDCDYLYTPTPGQIQCGVDYRWNSLPHCTIQGNNVNMVIFA